MAVGIEGGMTLSLRCRGARGLAFAGAVGALLPLTALVPSQGSTPTVIHFKGIHTVDNMPTARRFLPGTSRDFKLFAAYTGGAERRWAREAQESGSCVRNAGVVVSAYVDGYAYGDEGSCGGFEALWTNRYTDETGTYVGVWHQVIGTQDGWYCAPLRKYRVPSALVGDSCYSPRRGAALPYHQA